MGNRNREKNHFPGRKTRVPSFALRVIVYSQRFPSLNRCRKETNVTSQKISESLLLGLFRTDSQLICVHTPPLEFPLSLRKKTTKSSGKRSVAQLKVLIRHDFSLNHMKLGQEEERRKDQSWQVFFVNLNSKRHFNFPKRRMPSFFLTATTAPVPRRQNTSKLPKKSFWMPRWEM